MNVAKILRIAVFKEHLCGYFSHFKSTFNLLNVEFAIIQKPTNLRANQLTGFFVKADLVINEIIFTDFDQLNHVLVLKSHYNSNILMKQPFALTSILLKRSLLKFN